jgi:uncharacterized protein YcnI
MKRLAVLALTFTLVGPAAYAHVTVAPMRSDAGAVQDYELRCHNEDPAATTALDLDIPDGVTVLEVSPVEGGSFETVKTGDRISKIVWNVNVPNGKYVELKFKAKNPAAEQDIYWNIDQHLDGGKTVSWSNKAGAEKKGTITKITAAAPAASAFELKIPGRRNWTPFAASSGQFAMVVWVASTTDGTSDLYAVTSNDGGATFSEPRRVNDIPGDVRTGGEYAPEVAIGPQRLHVAWMSSRDNKVALRVARSADRGQTFSPAQTLHEEGLINGRGWQSIGLGPDGTLHAVWLDGRNDTTAAEHAEHMASQPGRPAMHGGHMDLFYGALGATAPQATSRLLASNTCQCCKTALAIGSDGSINTAWRQIFGEDIRDIAFMRSASGGKSFGGPVRVSEDKWQLNGCPDDGPTMAADSRGGVHVAWPTLVDGDNPRIALFYAYSADGKTFTPRVEVANLGSPKPSHIQMTLRPDGRLALAWDELSDGVRKIAMATGTIDRGGVAHFTPAQLVSDPAVTGTYPTVAATPAGFLVAWTSGVAEASTIKVARAAAQP